MRRFLRHKHEATSTDMGSILFYLTGESLLKAFWNLIQFITVKRNVLSNDAKLVHFLVLLWINKLRTQRYRGAERVLQNKSWKPTEKWEAPAAHGDIVNAKYHHNKHTVELLSIQNVCIKVTPIRAEMTHAAPDWLHMTRQQLGIARIKS